VAELAIQLWPTRPIYTDKGSGAGLNVAIYEPDGIPEGWYFLGHQARRMPSSWKYTDSEVAARAPTALLVQPTSNDPGAISQVQPHHDQKGQLQPQWTDQDSHGDQNVEIYSFTASAAGTYEPFGLFASVVEHYGQDPTQNPAWAKLAAVRNDLVREAQVGAQIWTDQHSGAEGKGEWRNISLWAIAGSLGLVPLDTFVGAEGYGTSPSSTSPPPSLLVNRITPS
jgi:hypothetical protein